MKKFAKLLLHFLVMLTLFALSAVFVVFAAYLLSIFCENAQNAEKMATFFHIFIGFPTLFVTALVVWAYYENFVMELE